MKKETKKDKIEPVKSEEFPLPIYSEDEDIYSREKKVGFEEEEELKGLVKLKAKENQGNDLDIPGTELDDADEEIGEEDEENNYYSLGGDRHEDLEEEKE
jgi:hypothetical protein